MTIAAGFWCNEGIVLCTDSQHTVSGYIKTNQGKIWSHIHQDSIVSFAGAGTSDYINTAVEKASKGLHELSNIEDIEKALEENLLSFFDNHISKWAYFPENERPTVELLIGVSTRKGPYRLYHYAGTSFNQTGCMAIGTGILLADNLISEYAFGLNTLDQLINAGIYILSKVKENVDSCGGFTDIVALKKGRHMALYDDEEVKNLESSFKGMEKENTEQFKKFILSENTPRVTWITDPK